MDVCRERSGPPVAPRGPPLSPREILDPYAPALALFRPNPSPEPGFPLLKIYEPPLNAPLPPLLSLSLSRSLSLSLARSLGLPADHVYTLLHVVGFPATKPDTSETRTIPRDDSFYYD